METFGGFLMVFGVCLVVFNDFLMIILSNIVFNDLHFTLCLNLFYR